MAHSLKNVLDAAEQLQKNKKIRFLLAGAGAERDKLLKDAEKRSLSNVIFMPMQPKEKMPAVWSLCNIALVHLKDNPAFSEVIPSKIFEAMAMGLPVLIAIPNGEARKIVENNAAGIWVPPENPNALVNAVQKLSNDTQLCAKLGENSLVAASRYSRSVQADKMISVFEKALL
jgi:glycosyltransferase involved in cell wall biosynthesis